MVHVMLLARIASVRLFSGSETFLLLLGDDECCVRVEGALRVV